MAEPKLKAEKKVAATKKASAPKTAPKPKTTTAKKPSAAKSASKTTTKKTKASTANLEQRYRIIEVAAYYIAEKDGFAGNPVEYWIAAEAQISSTDQSKQIKAQQLIV